MTHEPDEATAPNAQVVEVATQDTASTATRTAMAITPAITACHAAPDLGIVCLTLQPLLVASTGSVESERGAGSNGLPAPIPWLLHRERDLFLYGRGE